jgi:hypothetical protein
MSPRSHRAPWILALLLLCLSACPAYEICVEVGECPDVAMRPAPKPAPKPAAETSPSQSPTTPGDGKSQSHDHCGAGNQVLCIPDDGRCCLICGVRCP